MIVYLVINVFSKFRIYRLWEMVRIWCRRGLGNLGWYSVGMNIEDVCIKVKDIKIFF